MHAHQPWGACAPLVLNNHGPHVPLMLTSLVPPALIVWQGLPSADRIATHARVYHHPLPAQVGQGQVRSAKCEVLSHFLLRRQLSPSPAPSPSPSPAPSSSPSVVWIGAREPVEERPSTLARRNVYSTLGIFMGICMGSLLAALLPTSLQAGE